ncbi:MAG: hypothetical protein IV090_05980 [Candidatus Sericytochromatia bacterium]|nr:hypothetical protein [Candidatus Sericytochromatia bacterium]
MANLNIQSGQGPLPLARPLQGIPSAPAKVQASPLKPAADKLSLNLPPAQGPQKMLSLAASLPTQVAASQARFQGSKEAYFAHLDKDPAFRAKAQSDAVGAMLDFLSRSDVPLAVEKAYTKEAGSPGGGRLLLLLDYTRGVPSNESKWQALKQGPMHYLSSKVLTPRLTHFREVEGGSLFPGDVTMTQAFQDSPLWGPKTNQVGHMLCALETGVRMGKLAQSDLQRKAFDLGIKAANQLAGFEHIQDNAMDFSRAGIIGHEMLGDGGFLGQMKAYDQLVANGDPDQIRSHWDQAVHAAQAGQHDKAFEHIVAISQAIEAPSSPAEVAQNLAKDKPRFASPHQPRDGNSHQDIALSVYGFALGYQAMTQGLPSPQAAKTAFESLFSEKGAQAAAINEASQKHPSVLKP